MEIIKVTREDRIFEKNFCRKREITDVKRRLVSPCHSGCRGPLPRALATKSVPEDCARGDEEATRASTSDGVRREPLPGRRGRGARVPDMFRRPRGPRPGRTTRALESEESRRSPPRPPSNLT